MSNSIRGLNVDFELVQGKTWEIPILINGLDGLPLDLTDVAITAMGRKKLSDTAPAFTFAVTKDGLQGTTGKGQATLSLSNTLSAAVASAEYHYDVEATYNERVYEVMYGIITVPGEATKP